MRENPCWKGYEAYGTKQKGPTKVPNCVPVKSTKPRPKPAKPKKKG